MDTKNWLCSLLALCNMFLFVLGVPGHIDDAKAWGEAMKDLTLFHYVWGFLTVLLGIYGTSPVWMKLLGLSPENTIKKALKTGLAVEYEEICKWRDVLHDAHLREGLHQGSINWRMAVRGLILVCEKHSIPHPGPLSFRDDNKNLEEWRSFSSDLAFFAKNNDIEEARDFWNA